MPTASSPSTVMHRMKPDGYGENPLVDQLRKLACEIQEQTDKAHALIAEVHQPADLAKGAFIVYWDGHAPLQLEVTEDSRGKFHLEDIRVRGVSVSEWLQSDLWEQAEQWMHEMFDREPTEGEKRRVRRMDEADRLAELAT